MQDKTILVTGGAGYIGSHAVVALQQDGWQVVVVDNLCNSSAAALEAVAQITGRQVKFYQGDIRCRKTLQDIFAAHDIFAVMHFAGLKSVAESCAIPAEYYHNNIYGTLQLTQAMAAAGVGRLIFSSSATVYGEPSGTSQYTEDMPTVGQKNPYGKSKAMVETILADLAASKNSNWQIALLRYFNPIGAHPSGLIGEDPNGIPNNLLPFVAQVAIGKLKQLAIFGNDYPTPDGTGIRDYIHVVDLVAGHLAALRLLAGNQAPAPFCQAYNLGTGKGYSVLEVVAAFEKVAKCKINFSYAPRRDGDVAQSYAAVELAAAKLGWSAAKGLPEMIADTWRWQTNNPDGYGP